MARYTVVSFPFWHIRWQRACCAMSLRSPRSARGPPITVTLAGVKYHCPMPVSPGQGCHAPPAAWCLPLSPLWAVIAHQAARPFPLLGTLHRMYQVCRSSVVKLQERDQGKVKSPLTYNPTKLSQKLTHFQKLFNFLFCQLDGLVYRHLGNTLELGYFRRCIALGEPPYPLPLCGV